MVEEGKFSVDEVLILLNLLEKDLVNDFFYVMFDKVELFFYVGGK